MKALIFENKVVDTAVTEFEVHSSMTWMDCPDECKVGEWELVDGNLQPIPEPEDTRTYADFRRADYPPLEEQLDYIYHNGVEAWKADMILPVKTKHPKGGN